jgi:hypothetical protein
MINEALGGSGMPDGTRECSLIMAELHTIKEMQALHGKLVKEEIETIKAELFEIKIQRAEERGQFTGATWALAKVGAASLMLLSAVGWFAAHGLPDWIKQALK